MHRKILSLFLIGFVCISIFNWGCTKLDTTTLGSDLIPAVDNVNTFADTLYVDGTQNDYLDTTYISRTADHVVGNISNDPLFGNTTASIYFQLKPEAYPYKFAHDTALTGAGVGFDSVVLCLNYRGFWGDSNTVQQLQAFRIVDAVFKDSLNKAWTTAETAPTATEPISDVVNVYIPTLDEYIKYANKRDSFNYRIRIKLKEPYISELLNSDTAATGPGNHAFHNDSLFRRAFHGIAVKPVGSGTALIYVNLADTSTKLEVHFRMKNLGKIDTVYRSLTLETSASSTEQIKNSRTANHIERDRSTSPSQTPAPDVLYLQTQPGTYASLSIPRLNTYKDTNRIIHRAELIIEQIPDNAFFDSAYVAPNYLYLDLKDTALIVPPAVFPNYKPVYVDLNPGVFYDPDNKLTYFYPLQDGPDFSYYGGFARRKPGPAGGSIVYYNINITRYIQQLVTKHNTNYNMRLFPAYSIHYNQYQAYIPYNNSVAFGRIKVGSGNNTTYPMRLRIIYSVVK